MSKDSLGDRMKSHEDRTRYYLPLKTYTMIRLDGKSFHTYTRLCERPFDKGLMEDMQNTTLELCAQLNAKIGYVQSDEISLLLTDFDNITTQAWFDGNLQKICSVSSSIATAEFNQLRMIRANSFDIKLANFDSRVWTLSDPWEVFNTFLWRQNDASKNSVQMVAQSLVSHSELQNKNFKEQNELIFSKGQNWNNYPTDCKRGAFVYKNDLEWIIDREAPVLSQDKNWFFKKIPLIKQPEIF